MGQAERPEHADLARALELERHESGEHADEGDGDGERAQDAGDREGAIEDPKRGFTQRAVGADEDVLAARGALAQSSYDRVRVDAGRDLEGEARDPAVVPEAVVGLTAH